MRLKPTLILLLFALAFASCFHPPQLVPVQVDRVAAPCLSLQPPVDSPADPGDLPDCPPQYLLCLPPVQAAALAANLAAHGRWMAEAWTRCGPPPAPAVPPAAPPR